MRSLPTPTNLLMAFLIVTASAGAAPSAPPTDVLADVGGRNLHLVVRSGAGPVAVVFESGGAADASAWSTVPDLVASSVDGPVVTYDRAGLGTSDLGPEDLSPWQEVADLDRALESVGVRRFILVGHSYGGLLALYNAESHPDRVVGLVLVDPMNPAFVNAMGLDWMQATVPDITEPTTPFDHVVVRMKTTFGELVHRTADGLPSIDVPIIVITAGRLWWDDPTADAAWRQSHEALAAASHRELVVATESEHDIPGSEPELVVNAIQRVLERIDRE